ncbi:hypothetical protein AB870_25325 (plasmid) [Pandoraea faecigallinarum]|uniref:DUF2946 domain-containing protein n=1 Tax=Pandoraea faecigallinarum TaxID=656179 RepID=A0A0H3X0W2_9BURK|nr:DUF2946 domain-containing protein [Pandoraea faecigallinarum]AKM33500.1 hypothetical protein AB870_25325 [Pandoraea faecigallinarum]
MPYQHRYLTAWLGVFAIWLAIAAPLASQWRVAHTATPEAILCSAAPSLHYADSADGASRLHDPAGHLDACGYCGFFAHLPAILATAVTPFVLVSLLAVRAAVPPVIQPRAERYPCARRSRAPPDRS